MTKTINKLYILAFAFCAFFSLSMDNAHAREMTEYPRVKLQSLDKATARTMTFEAKVGSTLKFGPLYMKVLSCQKSSPIDQPESAAFLQIWEVDTHKKAHWVFSGWMFASSPALSPMNHAIYDVWVIDCLDYDPTAQEESTEGEPTESDDTQAVPPENTDQGDMLEE